MPARHVLSNAGGWDKMRTVMRWWLPSLLTLLVVSLPGCRKPAQDRAESATSRAAVQAIQAYSAAADTASTAHASVLQAFDQANHSASLADYRRNLREQVLPAMDAFVLKLKAVPTATSELQQIHGKLVAAYEQARRDIDDFEKTLEGLDGLARFGAIRDRLQEAVGKYRAALQTYYARYKRQLKVEPAATGPLPPTATGAP